MTPDFDKEKTKKTISLVLEKIKTEVDLQTLDEYLRLFKKETTVFNRNLAAAYLLMLCDQEKTLRLNDYKKRPNSSSRAVSSGTEENTRSDTQRYPLAEEESTKLFFSVGRSRRVFPREILGIINTKTAVPREDIGAIRILDNYSFVQVRDSAAEKIIEALNGMNFRGRPLTVNYAKSNNKDEDMTLTAASEQNLDDPKKENDI